VRNRLLLALFAAATVTLSACGINSIPTAEEAAKAKWADVQAAYQRRLDSLPSLTRTAVAAGANERDLQVGVAQARNAAQGAQVNPDQLTDPAAMQRFQAAQEEVGRQIAQFVVRVTTEATPENRSNQAFLELQQQIEGSNNRINIALRDYNAAVQAYNTEIRTFPGVIGARVIYGSQPMVPVQAQSGAERAPELNFNRQ
jgi:LemA protein